MKDLSKLMLLLMIFYSCKEPYTAPITSPATGFLVVEGFINSGEGPTTITLTRTTKLDDTSTIVRESQAQVFIEGESNSRFALGENGPGVYTTSSVSLNQDEKYRLHIILTDGKEYVSDYSTVRKTPDIDSITWQRDNGGLRLYVNAHDAANQTRYYQWNYAETWEINSAYASSIKYRYDSATNLPVEVVYRNGNQSVDTTIYRCWQSNNSTSISIGSTEKLSQDLVYLPIAYIEPQSEKLSVLYSIKVNQYALSHEAYLFLQKMKKNSEQLGSIFDPQPSDLQGNIHCVSDPKETVVGFVEVTQEKSKRVFISKNMVPDWGYTSGCYTTKIDNNPDSILKYGADLEPTIVASFVGLAIKDFYASEVRCVDCTTKGTNIKPDFWP